MFKSGTRLIGIVSIWCISGAASAQWSPDPATNLQICARNSDQTQPKFRAAPDGSLYLSWFDNAAGGYDVYLQHLTANGVEILPHNGVLIADRSYSSTQDYDMVVDSAGNAVMAFNDNRSGNDQITVTKVAPNGTQLWGPTGTLASSVVTSKGPPHVAVLTTGDIVVGWSESSTVKLQKISANGALIGSPVTITETGHGLTCSDVKASDNGSFIVLWVRTFTTSFLSSKYLYTQKYDANMTSVWTPTAGSAAVVVYGPTGAPYGTQGGSVQNGYFPTFVSDSNGGGVFAWYENAGPRLSYVQHVKADGTFTFAANGLAVATPPGGFIMTSNDVSYNAATGEMVCAYSMADSATQGTFQLGAQKISDVSGQMWGAGGVIVQATTNLQKSFVRTAWSNGGSYIAAFESYAFGGTTQRVEVTHLNADGTSTWGITSASSRASGKGRLDIASGSNGDLYMAWADGSAGGYDLYAQNVHADGTFGPSCRADFNHDSTVDFFDYLDFVDAFSSNDSGADFNGDSTIDFFDYLDFVDAFSLGC